MAYYIYAETAFHHEGDLAYLKQLIRLAGKLGLDGIKFQVLTNIDYLISSKHTAYEAIKAMVLTEEQWLEAFETCKQEGLDIIFMPINPKAVNLFETARESVRYFDLHSVSFNDTETLVKIKQTGIPLILGIGGRTLEEVKEKQQYFGNQLQVLMVGFQAFPSILKDVKIEKIAKLKALFPKLKIGYADHSAFDNPDAARSNELAYTLGARVFEKHLTLSEGIVREDYESAVGESQFAALLASLDYLDKEVFSHTREEILNFSEAELNYRNRERVAVAAADLKAGHIISPDDFIFKMIDKPNGIPRPQALIGKQLLNPISYDDIITSADLG